jgi:hypothetical protein
MVYAAGVDAPEYPGTYKQEQIPLYSELPCNTPLCKISNNLYQNLFNSVLRIIMGHSIPNQNRIMFEVHHHKFS